MRTATDPSLTSSEYKAMQSEWELIADILGGVEAVRARKTRYLTQYELESNESYKRRIIAAPWRPEFADCLRSISSKPFGKEVSLKGNVPDNIAGTLDAVLNERRGGLVDDIDGRGNNLTVFAREAFAQGIARGLHAIMVDYPTMAPGTTVAAEREAGARPYWVHVQADRILALYTEVRGGREVITHVRIRETRTERDGFGEITINQVRILEPGAWEIWEQDPATSKWALADEGKLARGNHISVPLVLFFTGDRIGMQAVRPPLSDLAHLQIELFRALSRQEEILTFAGSPMLAANGMTAPKDGQKIQVGPGAVLFAPPVGDRVETSWAFVQPEAANLKEVREHVASIQADMRRIGLQPLTESPGNATATGKAIDAAKAHSAVKAWALGLNDALEQAFVLTAQWMGLSETIETEVSTDFSVQPYAQHPLQSLAAARGTGDLSRATYWQGLRRFDVLPEDFDPDAEVKLIDEEAANAALAGNAKPAVEEVQVRL